MTIYRVEIVVYKLEVEEYDHDNVDNIDVVFEEEIAEYVGEDSEAEAIEMGQSCYDSLTTEPDEDRGL